MNELYRGAEIHLAVAVDPPDDREKQQGWHLDQGQKQSWLHALCSSPDGLPQFLELPGETTQPWNSWLSFPSDNEVKICPILMSFPFSPNKYPLPTSPMSSHAKSPILRILPQINETIYTYLLKTCSDIHSYQQTSHRYSPKASAENMLT